MNDKDNITIGRPKAGGALYIAPLGTALPTDADTSLSEDFVNLGYVSEDGLTMSTAEESDDIIAWGPEKVMNVQTSFGETVTYNLLETIRPAVLQYLRGSENVVINEDGSLASGTTGEPLPRCVLVVETLQNNGGANPRVHRVVYGDCQVVDRSGDQTYNNSDPVMFPVSVAAYKFDSQALPGKQVYHDDFWSATTPSVSA